MTWTISQDVTELNLTVQFDGVEVVLQPIITVREGGVNWGEIGGTLSDQTDLQTALDLKANDADISVVGFTNDYDDLDGKPTMPSAAGADGEIQFNNGGVFGASSKLRRDGGTLIVTGEGSTNATTALLVENIVGTILLQIKDAGDLLINGEITAGYGGGGITTNTAFGSGALLSNTTGGNNLGIGRNALRSNTTGASNIAIGSLTLRLLTTGNNNVALGVGALEVSTTGGQNSAYGSLSLSSNTTGSNNSTLGISALRHSTTGGANIAMGAEAGRYFGALENLILVSNSIFIGWRAKALGNNQTNQIVIGYDAIGAGSNTVTIGNTSIVKTILQGTLNAGGLPTSSAGLASGDIWNDSGTLKIV